MSYVRLHLTLPVTVLDPSVVVPFPVIRGNTVITNIKGKKFQCLAFFAETQSLTVWIGHLHSEVM